MMTSFKREPSAEPASGSHCFDPLDTFINYDQTVVPTPSISPLSSRSKSVSTPPSSSSQQNTFIPYQQTAQTFAGPSHQYGEFRQQAGLPVGSLANTFAVNQADQFGYGRNSMSFDLLPPTDDGYFSGDTPDDFLDFGTTPTQTLNGDMDFDFTSLTDLTSSNSTFVDPATIGGQENTPNSNASQLYPGRVYPGMHQQAALAKAQAEASRQQQQQQQKQQQGLTHQQQKAASSQSRPMNRSSGSAKPPTDPIVEESISRLLNQMRQSSVASSNDDAVTPNANGNQSQARTRKDEEDMDEDERLLASEEGKKLSSKERRQLRNKVSARAFRSRRKEYIGQLEGELAAKQGEVDELRNKNEQLVSENTRLTDLTRMLLSSPAFSTFLNDLSNTGAPASIPELSRPQAQTPAPGLQSAMSRKDVNPNQGGTRQAQNQQQNDMHVGLAVIPEETSFNDNANGALNTGFANNMDFGGLYDAQVYAVTSVPQGPAVDSFDYAMLHGKPSNFVGSYSEVEDSKYEPAAVATMPTMDKPKVLEPTFFTIDEDEEDDSDPLFALFTDQSPPNPSSTSIFCAPEDCIFGDIQLEKAFGRVEIIVQEEQTASSVCSSATIERFERLCLRLEASSATVVAVTGRY